MIGTKSKSVRWTTLPCRLGALIRIIEAEKVYVLETSRTLYDAELDYSSNVEESNFIFR